MAVTNEGTMKDIRVVPAGRDGKDKGKFKVLINFIQIGVEYTSETQAQKEANDLKRKEQYFN